MESNIVLGPPSEDGTIYQITDVIEGKPVVIDINYSGSEDTLEFEWAVAEADSNPSLTAEELEEINDILECGREERYVRVLLEYYAGTTVNFDPNEYRDTLGLPTRNF